MYIVMPLSGETVCALRRKLQVPPRACIRNMEEQRAMRGNPNGHQSAAYSEPGRRESPGGAEMGGLEADENPSAISQRWGAHWRQRKSLN